MSSPPTLFLNKHHEVLDSVKGFFGGEESMRLLGTHTHTETDRVLKMVETSANKRGVWDGDGFRPVAM